DEHTDAVSRAIDDCLELYRSSARAWVQSLPAESAARSQTATLELMDDLARGLLIKVFLIIVQADRKFSGQESWLAQVLLAKLWGRMLSPGEVGEVLQELIPMSDKCDWYQLVRPFAEVPALRDRVSEVGTVVMRFGNLVAKVDGTIHPQEAAQLK